MRRRSAALARVTVDTPLDTAFDASARGRRLRMARP
jgi:hypothetical protein